MDVTSNARQTLIHDIQGSFIGTLSSGGALTKRGFRPFGESVGANSSFGFTGQRIDSETSGLYYYRARTYSPFFGRFNQADPHGYFDGANLYAYVGNDPLNLTDPFGFESTYPGSGGTIANLLPNGAPLTTLGMAFGGLGAAAAGFVTGDSNLLDEALQGLADTQQQNSELFGVLLGIGKVGGKAAIVRENAPDFLVDSSGTAFPVPAGATGPVPVFNKSDIQTGVAFIGGNGGTNGQVTTMRIMDPRGAIGNAPAYPNGYVKYTNNQEPTAQGVDP